MLYAKTQMKLNKADNNNNKKKKQCKTLQGFKF